MLDELLYVSPPTVSNSQHKSKGEQSDSLQFPKHMHKMVEHTVYSIIWLHTAQLKLIYDR
jgi:hypothetical protein